MQSKPLLTRGLLTLPTPLRTFNEGLSPFLFRLIYHQLVAAELRHDARTMVMSWKQASPDPLPRAADPIKYLTENGFTIIRLSEVDSSVVDTPDECSFMVHREDEAEREITVRFNRNLVEQLRIRRRNALPDHSVFWLVCAESRLANYLWEQNDFPPEGRLIIDELSPDELMLILHWRDRD